MYCTSWLYVFIVVAQLCVKLKNDDSTVSRIVSQWNHTLAIEDDETLLGKIQSELKNVHLSTAEVLFVHSNDIQAYFLCDSVDHLLKLRDHYIYGRLKASLNAVFAWLLSGDAADIDKLCWVNCEGNIFLA